MLITTKPELRGELYLSAIGHTLKAGKSTTIDDEYASDPDILWAISKGMIEIKLDNEGEDIQFNEDDVITLKNTGNKLLNLSFINKTVQPGYDFALSNDDFNRSEISSLIKNGSITVVLKEEVKKSSTKKKTTKKSVKKAAKKETNKTPETSNEDTLEDDSSKKDFLVIDPNKEKTSINENTPPETTPTTITLPEDNEDGIIFVDNNNEVK
tara:strand:- start:4078 stop:4710 length:633 start_codon:yes stop_codon:yes gene_type:complete